jgi:hypothetical protein
VTLTDFYPFDSASDVLSGHDNAPVRFSVSNEDIPKGAARVLNAANIRREYRTKRSGADADESGRPEKRRRTADGGEAKPKVGRRGTTESDSKNANHSAEMKILPGESLIHFNR